MKLYISNLDQSTKESDLKKLVEEHGKVLSVKIIVDHETGRSRGFGFVEMAVEEDTEKTLSALNGFNWNGRTISVAVARERGAK